MTQESESGEGFQRLKFTLTDEIIEMIDELAARYTAGNRSQLIRKVVREKYQHEDEGGIYDELRRIRQQIEQLPEELEEEFERKPPPPGSDRSIGGSSPESMNVRASGLADADAVSPAAVARELMDAIPDEDPFRLDDIQSEVEYPLSKIVAGLEQLAESNIVEELDTDSGIQYRSA